MIFPLPNKNNILQVIPVHTGKNDNPQVILPPDSNPHRDKNNKHLIPPAHKYHKQLTNSLTPTKVRIVHQ